MFALAAIVGALGSPAAAASLPSPIAAASEGKLQCYSPTLATKSCQSMASYAAVASGGIVNPATVLISPAPLITMRTVTPVTIKANQVCGFIRASDIEAASFTIAGAAPTVAQTTFLRQKVAEAQKGVFGHEICTAYVPDGEALIAKAYVDARVTTIYGGTTEIMKEIIGRSLDLG